MLKLRNFLANYIFIFIKREFNLPCVPFDLATPLPGSSAASAARNASVSTRTHRTTALWSHIIHFCTCAVKTSWAGLCQVQCETGGAAALNGLRFSAICRTNACCNQKCNDMANSRLIFYGLAN